MIRTFTAEELDALGVHPETAVSFTPVGVRPKKGEVRLPPDLFINDLVFEEGGRYWRIQYRYPHLVGGPYPPEVLATEVELRSVVTDQWQPKDAE